MPNFRFNKNLAEIAGEIRSGAMDMTRDGECVGCGECCSNLLPLTPTDITRIRRYVAKNGIKPASHVLAPLAMKAGSPTVDLVCPFMDPARPAGQKCAIYPVRPTVCRHFICSPSHRGEAEKAFMDELSRDKSLLRELSSMSFAQHFRDVRATFFGNGK